ncbi:MAG: spore coat protein [Ruminococcaceae bacterium]|nr:spore coat protein [Oscillospiraceae bacterium]
MAQITTKELGAIGDGLSLEENLIAKYRFYACTTDDSALKDKYEQMAESHQRHYDELFSHLK